MMNFSEMKKIMSDNNENLELLTEKESDSLIVRAQKKELKKVRKRLFRIQLAGLAVLVPLATSAIKNKCEHIIGKNVIGYEFSNMISDVCKDNDISYAITDDTYYKNNEYTLYGEEVTKKQMAAYIDSEASKDDKSEPEIYAGIKITLGDEIAKEYYGEMSNVYENVYDDICYKAYLERQTNKIDKKVSNEIQSNIEIEEKGKSM